MCSPPEPSLRRPVPAGSRALLRGSTTLYPSVLPHLARSDDLDFTPSFDHAHALDAIYDQNGLTGRFRPLPSSPHRW